jgi:hypothetical protein
MQIAPLPAYGIGDFNALVGRMHFYNNLTEETKKYYIKTESDHQKEVIKLLKEKRDSIKESFGD